jgi:ATP-binding cassette subfamily B protein
MRFLRLYARVIAVLRPDRTKALWLMAANLLIAGLLFVEPLLFGRVIQMLADASTMGRAELIGSAVTLLGSWAVVGLLGIVASIAASLHAERLAHRNRLQAMARFYQHVLALPPAFHSDTRTGGLMKVMLSGADTMFWLWLSLFRDQLGIWLALIILPPLTLFLNWRLAIALVVLVPLFAVLILLVVRKTEGGQRRAQHWQIELVGTAQDALANVTVVQSFTRLGDEMQRFGAIMQEVIRHQFPVLNWWAVANVMTRGASTVAVITIVITGTVLHARDQASVGEIVTFMGLASLLISRLDGAMQFATRLFSEMPGLGTYFDVLDAESAVPDRPGAYALPPGPGEVTFDGVSFAYPTGTQVLFQISVSAPPGRTIALVGATGAGKSTCMALLERFWDPQSGAIRIDGHDIRDVTLDSLRARIGVVFQDSMLLNRSIRENLLIGRPDATQAQIEAATTAAEAHAFILATPEGYETMVGERGGNLSGGQRQRLAIARALLKDPPILILDEATSALDAETEARVAVALRRLMRGRTCFVIAHRLSTVRDADTILVFEHGRIVEQGSFAALMDQKGRFAALVATQLAPAG